MTTAAEVVASAARAPPLPSHPKRLHQALQLYKENQKLGVYSENEKKMRIFLPAR